MLNKNAMHESSYIVPQALLTKFWTFFEVKAAAAAALGVLGWLYDPLYKEALFALFVLVLIDFYTGTAASKKEGTLIRSAKLRETAKKLAAYYTMIAAGHISELALPVAQFAVIDETILGYLVATELVSILENMGRLGYATPTMLLDKLRAYTRKA